MYIIVHSTQYIQDENEDRKRQREKSSQIELREKKRHKVGSVQGKAKETRNKKRKGRGGKEKRMVTRRGSKYKVQNNTQVHKHLCIFYVLCFVLYVEC